MQLLALHPQISVSGHHFRAAHLNVQSCQRCYAGLDPTIYHDKYGVQYLKTGKGNQVAVGTDKATGNIMMVDPAGNLYYDTGDQKLGFYMVRASVHRWHGLDWVQDENSTLALCFLQVRQCTLVCLCHNIRTAAMLNNEGTGR